jgi:hypothetical protein
MLKVPFPKKKINLGQITKYSLLRTPCRRALVFSSAASVFTFPKTKPTLPKLFVFAFLPLIAFCLALHSRKKQKKREKERD